MVTTVSTALPFRIGPLNNIQPFTYAQGVSHTLLLERLRVYINDVLRVEFNDELERILTETNLALDNQDADFETRFADWVSEINALIASINNKTGPVSIRRATLTAPYTVTIDPVWPSDHVIDFQLTQDATGGRTVSLGAGVIGGPVTVNTSPNGVTDFELVPVGNGTWRVRQTAKQIQDAIAGKLDTATAAATYETKADADASADAALDLFAPISGSADYMAPGDVAPVANQPVKVGVVLDRGLPGQWDAGLVESLHVIKDPESGRLAGVYVGYNDTTANLSTSIGQIGVAYSDDGLLWEKGGILLPPSGTAGAADIAGCSGPVLILHNGLYHLFYIGLSQNGYEGGEKTLMLATSPSLRNPVWTRRGAVLTKGGTGWRSINIWHPSIVRHENKWYCFINASGIVGGVDRERIGYATADELTGPWTWDDINSPVLFNNSGICGDPSVTKIPGGWRMDYFTTDGVAGAADWYTTTTDAAFPLGWRAHNAADVQRRTIQPGPVGTMDDNYAHKPVMFHYAGRTIHYYTAVSTDNVRRVAAAVDGQFLSNRGPSRVSTTQPVYGTFSHVKSALGQPDHIADTDFSIAMPPVAVVSAKPGDLLEFTVNYGANLENVELRADVCLLSGPSGTALTYVSGQPEGISGWGMAAGVKDYKSATYKYRVTAADIHKGTVTAAPVFRTTAGTRRVFCMDVVPLEFSAHNLG